MIPGVLKFIVIITIISSSFFLNAKPIESELAEIQILDKITAKVKTYKILNNNSLKIDSLNIEIYACYKNSPDEIPENYVLLRIYDDMMTNNEGLIYQGWMISSSPASTPLEHPIYDLWLKDCRMESDF
tara:strand:- start:546 stop:932 length:387 start_codon:yes stop_codon:yes gene_type:complete